MSKKLIISVILILIIGFSMFVIFQPGETPSQTAKIIPANLDELKITKVGKSVSEGVAYDKYAFKTKVNNVIKYESQN